MTSRSAKITKFRDTFVVLAIVAMVTGCADGLVDKLNPFADEPKPKPAIPTKAPPLPPVPGKPTNAKAAVPTASVYTETICKVRDGRVLPPNIAEDAFRCLAPRMRYTKSGHRFSAVYPGWSRRDKGPFLSKLHGSRYVAVYANDLALTTISTAPDAPVQVGAIMATPSFSLNDDGTLDVGPLFILEKMPKGFSTAKGNWRYTVIGPEGDIIGVSKGQNAAEIEFCKKCTRKSSDSVYLALLRGQPPIGRTGPKPKSFDPSKEKIDPTMPILDPNAPVVGGGAPAVVPSLPQAPLAAPTAPVGGPVLLPGTPGGPARDPKAPAAPKAAVLDPKAPLLDPNAPVLDPNAPIAPKGAVLDPNAPVLDPNAPVLNPNAPITPKGAVLDPNAPVLNPNAPVLNPNAPVLNPNAPVLDPNAPVLDPNAPVLDPNAPIGGGAPKLPPAPTGAAKPAKPNPLSGPLLNPDAPIGVGGLAPMPTKPAKRKKPKKIAGQLLNPDAPIQLRAKPAKKRRKPAGPKIPLKDADALLNPDLPISRQDIIQFVK